jgi:hypothetical protein
MVTYKEKIFRNLKGGVKCRGCGGEWSKGAQFQVAYMGNNTETSSNNVIGSGRKLPKGRCPSCGSRDLI